MTEITTPPARKPAFNAALLDSLALAFLILAMCTQINLADIGKDTYATEGHVTKQLKVALPDIALLLVFGWFVVRTTVLRAWKKLWWPPFACWALIFAMVVAALHSPTIVTAVSESLAQQAAGSDSLTQPTGPEAMIKAFITKESKEAIAEIIQFTAYFIFAPLLFVNMMHDRRASEFISRRLMALTTFGVALLLATMAAAWQSFTVNVDLPRALFATPNAYAGFLAIGLPLLTTAVMHKRAKQVPLIIIAAVTLVLALFTIESYWAMKGACLGVIAAAFLTRSYPRAGAATLLATVVSTAVWLGPLQSAMNPTTAKSTLERLETARHDSVKAQGDLKEARKKREAEKEAGVPPEKTETAIKAAQERMREADTRAYNKFDTRVEFLRPESAATSAKKQYIEWYAALGWSPPKENTFATGVGPGNYQLNIGPYYASLPNEEKMPADSNNLYLVQAVSLGFLGLGALLWVLGHFARQAWLGLRRNPNDWLGAGVLGSLVAFFFVNLFHALIVRGTGIVLAFILALAVVAYQNVERREVVD